MIQLTAEIDGSGTFLLKVRTTPTERGPDLAEMRKVAALFEKTKTMLEGMGYKSRAVEPA